MFAFVVLGLVSSEIGWEERLQNDLFCDEYDIKTKKLTQSQSQN